jgi:hypothetical protein
MVVRASLPPAPAHRIVRGMLAADFPFMDVLWSMVIFFCWIVWIWMMIAILTDVFRRHDIGGGQKALWVIFLIVLPFLGVLIYLIAQHDGMMERNVKQVEQQQQMLDQHIRTVASSDDPALKIANAKKLLDDGAIDQAEFDTLKQKALATA